MFAPDCNYCAIHNNVKSVNIVKYVEATGWTRENQENPMTTKGVKVKYYTKLVDREEVNWRYVGEQEDGTKVFILKILLDNHYRDYDKILVESILMLAFAENRPCYKIIEDINKFDVDTFSSGEGI